MSVRYLSDSELARLSTWPVGRPPAAGQNPWPDFRLTRNTIIGYRGSESAVGEPVCSVRFAANRGLAEG